MKYNFFFLILPILLLTSCSKNENDLPNNEFTDFPEEVITDIQYGPDKDQTLDLYLPGGRTAEKTKVLVFIHGGGWISGDKSDMQDYIPIIKTSLPEYAIANINYRLALPPSRSAFPNQFLDVESALNYLTEEAEEMGIKAEFALIGASAGAHLALQFDSVYDLNDQVKMICSIVGPTNFTDPFYTENPDFDFALEQLVDEEAYPNIIDFARIISPAHMVTGSNSPTILFYGENDPLVPVSNGKFLKDKLDAMGVTNSFTLYQGGHGDWENESNTNMQVQLIDFIEEHFASEN